VRLPVEECLDFSHRFRPSYLPSQMTFTIHDMRYK
jgi:hypothetical protein